MTVFVRPCSLASPVALGTARLASPLAVLGFALLTALLAQVKVLVPGTVVPMTLQLLGVLLAGYFLSPGAAAASMGVYVVAGVAGLPVIATPGVLIGPTGGFLLGFPIVAALLALFVGNAAATSFRLVFAGLAAVIVLFAFGVGWLAAWYQDVPRAVAEGFVPFAGKACIEVLLAAGLAGVFQNGRMWARIQKWRKGVFAE